MPRFPEAVKQAGLVDITVYDGEELHALTALVGVTLTRPAHIIIGVEENEVHLPQKMEQLTLIRRTER